MQANIEEAIRAKENAEKLFSAKDFIGAKNCALKAQMLCPELEGISQMVVTFEVYAASVRRINGEINFYSILGLESSAEESKLKKQYRKMAVLLHPDKNKTVGADGAFKLVSEAWTLLSDNVKRSSYQHRMNKNLSSGAVQTNFSSVHTAGVTGYDNCSKSSNSHGRLDTFWTVCTSCHVQYEYLRKYVNKKLSCKNCRGIFVAVETGAAPLNGSFPYSPWSYAPNNGYRSHGYEVSYIPNTTVYFTGNGVSGHHSGPEYVSNTSFQWNSYPGAVDPRVSSMSANVTLHSDGSVSGIKADVKQHKKNVVVDMGSNGYIRYDEPAAPKVGRPAKKRKVDFGIASCHGTEEMASKSASEVVMVNGNGNIKHNPKVLLPIENLTKRSSTAPAFDARRLLIDKARMIIRKKLEDMKLAPAAVATDEERDIGKSREAPKRGVCFVSGHQSELKRTSSTSITVPDSDFHDFDNDRLEECFKPKQIWALYDEEDGMPRLYCLIREVISARPFKIHISYLTSKSDSEFGSVNWITSGFTKSCGNFRAYNSEIVEQVNVFSHLLSREKAGRGGCIRIYPRSGDIWAVYRNWSPDWNIETPDELRHQYEMVEVIDDYSEEIGVWVNPLVKVDGFKTVYQRNMDKSTIRWITKREMLRFSHQVPSWLLKGDATNLPDGCWDLDPAATPDELLQSATEVQSPEKHCQPENCAGALSEHCQAEIKLQPEEKPSQTEASTVTPDLHLETKTETQIDEKPSISTSDELVQTTRRNPADEKTN